MVGWDKVEENIAKKDDKGDGKLREYELFNEVINEFIAQEITELLFSVNGHIFNTNDDARIRGGTNYEYMKFLVSEFYDTYKPKTTFEHNEKRDFEFKYLQDINGNRQKISYSPDDVIKYNVEYDSKDLDVYYNNPLEIEARAKQIDFYINYKKYMPNIKIDKDVQDYYIDTLVYICHTLLSE